MQMSQEKALSFSRSFSPLSLALSACLCCPNSVLQWACSVGSPCLIVCYFFNTYIMYFIRIRCQTLSVPLHPITLFFLIVGGSQQQINQPVFFLLLLLLVMHLPLLLACVFLPLPGIQLSWFLFYDVVVTSDDGFIISSPSVTALQKQDRCFPQQYAFSFTSGLCNPFCSKLPV